MTAGRQQLARTTARVYAVLVLLFGFFELTFGVFIMVMGSHAAPVGISLVVPGFILVALGSVLWLGAYWAAPLAFVCALFPGVFPFLWYHLAAGRVPTGSWLDILGLTVPTVFLVLTVLLLVSALRARPANGGTRLPGPTAPRALAAVAFSFGLCLLVLGTLDLNLRTPSDLSVPRVGYFLALPGAVLLALGPFIWLDRIWAMIAAFAASLTPWVYPIVWLLWMDHIRGYPSPAWFRPDWFSLSLMVVPTFFGILTVCAVLSTLRRGRTSATNMPR